MPCSSLDFVYHSALQAHSFSISAGTTTRHQNATRMHWCCLRKFVEVRSIPFSVMFLCDQFLLDISLLTEREVYSKGSQNKAENVQNWRIKLMNLCFNLRFTTHSVFLIVALRVKKWLATWPFMFRILEFYISLTRFTVAFLFFFLSRDLVLRSSFCRYLYSLLSRYIC